MDHSAPLALALCGHVYRRDKYSSDAHSVFKILHASVLYSLLFLAQGDQNFRFLLLSEVLHEFIFCIPLQYADENFFSLHVDPCYT